MTDFRALCEELVDELKEYVDADLPIDSKEIAKTELLIGRARAALAEQPVGPTESDVAELFYRHVGEGSEVGFENAIAEALARWGQSVVTPIPMDKLDRLIALDRDDPHWG